MTDKLKGLGWVTYKRFDWMGLSDRQGDLITLSNYYMVGLG
jgi:hypothetical protein